MALAVENSSFAGTSSRTYAELMMAPYAVGHLKMSFFLEGSPPHGRRRTDLLLPDQYPDMQELEQSRLPGYSSLAEESHLAGEVKKQAPILVSWATPILGAPSTGRMDPKQNRRLQESGRQALGREKP
jgi:hypothetical protein